MAAVSKFPRSIPDILSDLVNQFTSLIRKEGELARTEMSEKFADLALGLGFLVAGAVLLIPALVILLLAAVAGLVALHLAAGWASLIIGGVTLLIGIVLLAVAIRRLKASRPIPTKTIEQLELDARAARSQLESEDDPSKRAA